MAQVEVAVTEVATEVQEARSGPVAVAIVASMEKARRAVPVAAVPVAVAIVLAATEKAVKCRRAVPVAAGIVGSTLVAATEEARRSVPQPRVLALVLLLKMAALKVEARLALPVAALVFERAKELAKSAQTEMRRR